MKIALKRLTDSDLTFFESLFRRLGAGNQKAINLNADVFVEQLYPVLRDDGPSSGKLPIDLFVYGPGTYGELNLQRKIVKWGTYKNWRLNGEFISDPDGQRGRFDTLHAGDVAVLGFDGAPLPDTLRLALASAADDSAVHALLDQLLGRKRMVALDESDFFSMLENSRVPEDHVLWSLGAEEDLEDLGAGSVAPIRRLSRRRGGRRIDRTQLAKGRAAADLVGQVGEAIVASYLETRRESGAIRSYNWTSNDNAISPFDFEVEADTICHVEVKATSGSFHRAFHISMAELEAAASADHYDLYRVSEVDVSTFTGILHVSSDIGPHARSIVEASRHMPQGVTIDGVSMDPRMLAFTSVGKLTARGED